MKLNLCKKKVADNCWSKLGKEKEKVNATFNFFLRFLYFLKILIFLKTSGKKQELWVCEKNNCEEVLPPPTNHFLMTTSPNLRLTLSSSSYLTPMLFPKDEGHVMKMCNQTNCLQKHSKSATLSWHHNIKLSFCLLVSLSNRLFAFLYFRLFVFRLFCLFVFLWDITLITCLKGFKSQNSPFVSIF